MWVQCLVIMQFLFCLDEVQLVEDSSTSEEQTDPGPDATKADANHATDQAEEPEFTKEMEAPALPPESPLESETDLADVALQKIQGSEE